MNDVGRSNDYCFTPSGLGRVRLPLLAQLVGGTLSIASSGLAPMQQNRRRAAAATPWPVAKEVVQGLGDLTRKSLIDATNPVLPDLSGLGWAIRLPPPSKWPVGRTAPKW